MVGGQRQVVSSGGAQSEVECCLPWPPVKEAQDASGDDCSFAVNCVEERDGM